MPTKPTTNTTPITSGEQLREALGLRGPPPPRQAGPLRHDSAFVAAAAALPGAIRSGAALRTALGQRPPVVLRRPEAKPAVEMRQDAGPAAAPVLVGVGPIRSSAELRARLGVHAR